MASYGTTTPAFYFRETLIPASHPVRQLIHSNISLRIMCRLVLLTDCHRKMMRNGVFSVWADFQKVLIQNVTEQRPFNVPAMHENKNALYTKSEAITRSRALLYQGQLLLPSSITNLARNGIAKCLFPLLSTKPN